MVTRLRLNGRRFMLAFEHISDARCFCTMHHSQASDGRSDQGKNEISKGNARLGVVPQAHSLLLNFHGCYQIEGKSS
jgi:hypothetical protein